MWTGEYQKAYDAACEVIDSKKFTWAKVTNLQAGYDLTMATEHLFALNHLTMTNDVAKTYFSTDSPNSFAVTRERLLNYFNNATQDYRYTFLFKAGTATHAANRYLKKYDESASTDTYYRYKMPLMRHSEMYLIKSEVEYRREFLGEGQLFFLYKRLNRPTILYSLVDAVAEKVYTFPLPLSETESIERQPNK